ncbi:Wadjet anti-phage system protein JetD domain-containing protein [Loktanella sp. DJP18]|uniref:Wadjet anti-phage system protein JetD domain-containing protein n=1 Tax=Loktanella sp. DJP18 TaxID=3409788 RepID=UPI003BB7B1A8
MILKRPNGAAAEMPAALKVRLERTWDARVAKSITDQDNTEGEFPLTVSIGRPSLAGDAMVRRRAEIAEWITQWRDQAAIHTVSFEAMTKRRVGDVSLPDTIVFQTIDEMAAFLGSGRHRDLRTARSCVSVLAHVDRRLNAMAKHWQKLSALPVEEQTGFASLLEARSKGSDDLIDIRELAIVGLDSKWIETRQSIVREALKHIDCLKDGSSFREEFGFRDDDRQEIWMKFHPVDWSNPMGEPEMSMRPSKIKGLPPTVTRVVIVENKGTFNSHTPLPGVCLFFGSGNAIAGTAAAMPFLKALDIIYWGDLDSWGMKILSRLRRILPHTTTFAMDDGTMLAHCPLWTVEPDSDRYTGEIDRLAPQEASALQLIRKGHWRLEQERLTVTPDDIHAIGLARITKRQDSS